MSCHAVVFPPVNTFFSFWWKGKFPERKEIFERKWCQNHVALLIRFYFFFFLKKKRSTYAYIAIWSCDREHDARELRKTWKLAFVADFTHKEIYTVYSPGVWRIGVWIHISRCPSHTIQICTADPRFWCFRFVDFLLQRVLARNSHGIHIHTKRWRPAQVLLCNTSITSFECSLNTTYKHMLTSLL